MRSHSQQTLELDLWLVDPSQIRSMPLLTRYYELLNPQERERHSTFATAKLKHDFLVTRAFVRDLLSRSVNHAIAPHAWAFSENTNGRPAIMNPEFKEKLHFNISHTENLIACVVGRTYAIGIDVENLTRKIDYLSLAESCFAQPEIEDLILQNSASTLRRRFFEYWTLKEAYIKARGLGVSLPLENFNYKIGSSGAISIAFESPIVDRPDAWKFKIMQLAPNHLISIAAKTEGQEWIIRKLYLTPLADSNDRIQTLG